MITIGRKLATDMRFRVAFLLVGVAIAVPVGLITGKLGWATATVSVFVIAGGLLRLQYQRSLSR